MSDVGTKLQSDLGQTDADPLARTWVLYLASVAMTAFATVIAIGLDTKLTIPNLSLVFVIPVVVAGVGLGLGPSICSAVLGALAFNFFLTEPRYSLAVDDPANIWAIGLLLVVGLIVSGVAFTSRRRATEAALLKRQAVILQTYSREVVAADNMDAILSITSEALVAVFRAPAVLMLFDKKSAPLTKAAGILEPSEVELEAARACLQTGTVLRGGIYPHPESRFDFWPVQTGRGPDAVIGLAFDPDERPQAPDAPVTIVASILRLLLDRQPGRG
jgi:K+-sensing histidine kinase KdpD